MPLGEVGEGVAQGLGAAPGAVDGDHERARGAVGGVPAGDLEAEGEARVGGEGELRGRAGQERGAGVARGEVPG
ncbi:putative poly(aspartic acid) hydrolase [Streptomyces sp. Tu6071]|nr:putative poly(aspartic acid) hydrolase [Streptomyces sp. Tu6071]